MNNEYTPWELIVLKFLNKIFVTLVSIGLFCIVANYVIDLAAGRKPRKEEVGGNIWKNADPSRPAQDIKSYDYNTQTVTYRDYRGGQPPKVGDKVIGSDGKTYTWKEVEHRTVLYTLPNPANKKHGVTVKNGDMTVTIDLEEVFKDMPLHQREQFLQDIMDNVDYNDLLDYYGSPELR